MAGYLGNKSSMIVHHLAMMLPDCRIYYVKKEDKQYFVPDILEQAIKQKFVPCEHCIKKISN